MKVKFVLVVLILHVVVFKFYIILVTSFRFVKQFLREASRQEKAVSSVTAKSATLYQFAVLWHMHVFALTLTQYLLTYLLHGAESFLRS